MRRVLLMLSSMIAVVVVAVGSAVLVTPALAQPPSEPADSATTAVDGVQVDVQGDPFYATFSLCARDPATGELGVAVTTRVPFVGRAVPWVRADVGAVATQSWTIVEYGQQGLDLLEQGMAPQQALDHLLEDDAGRELRQLGILDAEGRSAAHTGSDNGVWAGSRQGPDYTVQGNILVGRQVIDEVADHFESTASVGMPLPERMLLALQAGQQQGGDKRWGRTQSAALRIADANSPGRGGDHISWAIDVGEHEHPVDEMLRIYYRTGRKLGYRQLAEQRGADVIELKRMLHRLGHWRPDGDGVPEAPEFEGDAELGRTDPQAFQQLIADYRQRAEAYEVAYALYDDETIEAVDAFRREHGLEHQGNPRGLVDERFVAALRNAYYDVMRQKPAAGADDGI